MQPLTGRSARPATQRSFPRSHAQAPGVCDERFDGFMAAFAAGALERARQGVGELQGIGDLRGALERDAAGEWRGHRRLQSCEPRR